MARTLNTAVYTIRREAFVDAAQRLMQTSGYEQMSIQDLLDELDASRGAFYHYFDSKQALLEAVIERMVDAALAAVQPMVDYPNLTALEKLKGVFGGIGRWKTERRALVLSLVKVWMSDDNALLRQKFRHRVTARMVPVLAGIVEQGVEERVFNAKSPADTANVLLILLLGFQDIATELFIQRQANSIDYEAVISTFSGYTDAFERILGAPPGSIEMIDEEIMQAWFA
ncbi:MAG TPA: TetR/AcrR family transcriptional regulator [Candidatus Dormibacteraeota bacterium]|nr:TetR/AcrR family transcriptional regulator [Candidatus Dormibacteraeota bacterium]